MTYSAKMNRWGLGLLMGLGAISLCHAAEVPKAAVPKSPYISVVYRYADTLIERGRDTFGPQKTGLFLSSLDRTTLAPLTNRPAAPWGVRESDRVGEKGASLSGAAIGHDENLLRLLYTLSELSGKPKYRAAADESLKWLLENAATSAFHLLPGRVARSWNVMTDQPNGKETDPLRQFFRPWLLWDRCFDVAPEASRLCARELWESTQQRAAATKNFGDAGPRQAGFDIRTWAVASARARDDQWLPAIGAMMATLEQELATATRTLPAGTARNDTAIASWLSCAIDCDGAAHRVAEPVATRLRACAARVDELFCELNKELKATGGFVMAKDGRPGITSPRVTSLWEARADGHTTAQIGMMCVSRYDNTGRVAYRGLITAAADLYLDAVAAEMTDVWPMTLGQAISLELAAWRHTARPVYLECARQLGDRAVEKFWGTNALPRASLKTDHYEAITGADTLALALLELHLDILHITAVRCPPNTLDR